jgi:hypothetical protein
MPVSKWHAASIICAVAFEGLSAGHLIDDFVSNVPAEFNLSVPATEGLALAYMMALVGLVAAAAVHSRTAYLGLIVAGSLIGLAQLLKSLPEILAPGPWHLGLVSEALALGLLAASAATVLTSFIAWRLSAVPGSAPDQESSFHELRQED